VVQLKLKEARQQLAQAQKFQFHSGSIKISTSPYSLFVFVLISIPQWFN